MKKVLELFFLKLSNEKGEDIFEYGFSGFDEVKYLNYLLNKKHINKDLYEELEDDGAELFQIISSVSEDDYVKCLSVFSEYLVETFTEEEIADTLILFFE